MPNVYFVVCYLAFPFSLQKKFLQEYILDLGIRHNIAVIMRRRGKDYQTEVYSVFLAIFFDLLSTESSPIIIASALKHIMPLFELGKMIDYVPAHFPFLAG